MPCLSYLSLLDLIWLFLSNGKCFNRFLILRIHIWKRAFPFCKIDTMNPRKETVGYLDNFPYIKCDQNPIETVYNVLYRRQQRRMCNLQNTKYIFSCFRHTSIFLHLYSSRIIVSTLEKMSRNFFWCIHFTYILFKINLFVNEKGNCIIGLFLLDFIIFKLFHVRKEMKWISETPF